MALRERGELRSGSRFARRNQPYFATLQELLNHHRRLLDPEPAITSKYFRVAGNGERNTEVNRLLQTTVRFPINFSNIRHVLRQQFIDLFREHSERSEDGFEVVVTFNAVLTNETRTTFSVFYGHDHRAGNVTGAANELRYGDTIVVNTLSDLSKIPTTFNIENLVSAHRLSFESSAVNIERFLNVVYLIYQFATPPSLSAKKEKRKSSSSSASSTLATK